MWVVTTLDSGIQSMLSLVLDEICLWMMAPGIHQNSASVLFVLVLLTVAAAARDPCNYAPWNETICCTEGSSSQFGKHTISGWHALLNTEWFTVFWYENHSCI